MNGNLSTTALTTTALFCLFGLSAAASAVEPPSSETASLAVSLADLDLTTQAGADAAAGRINAAAKKLCRQFADDRKVSAWATYTDCYHATTAEVFRQLEAGTRSASATR